MLVFQYFQITIFKPPPSKLALKMFKLFSPSTSLLFGCSYGSLAGAGSYMHLAMVFVVIPLTPAPLGLGQGALGSAFILMPSGSHQ